MNSKVATLWGPTGSIYQLRFLATYAPQYAPKPIKCAAVAASSYITIEATKLFKPKIKHLAKASRFIYPFIAKT